MTRSKLYRISGRVQGVYYRVSAQQFAQSLDLKGWVRNLEDGRVEVQAQGSEEALGTLEDWLWRGPDRAEVKDVVVSDLSGSESIEECQDFIVR